MAINYQKKTWIDRLSEFPSRRNIKDIQTQEVKTVEVSRAEGEVQVEGDSFDSVTMNLFEERIAAAFTETQAEIDALKAELQSLKGGMTE